jgi:DNA-binding MarR family transcriptional regulator
MPTKPNINRKCINFKSKQFARALTRLYDAELAKAGLKATQFSLLSIIFNRGPISPSKLALRMELDRSTMTRNLQPLIKAGFITLEISTNGRDKVIALSKAGQEKFIEADIHWNAAQQNVSELIGTERVNALYMLIDEGLNLIHQAKIL